METWKPYNLEENIPNKSRGQQINRMNFWDATKKKPIKSPGQCIQKEILLSRINFNEDAIKQLLACHPIVDSEEQNKFYLSQCFIQNKK